MGLVNIKAYAQPDQSNQPDQFAQFTQTQSNKNTNDTKNRTSPNYLTQRPLIELPIRFYMLEFETAQELNAQTKRAQLPYIIDSLNKIYARPSIKFKLISGAPMPLKASKLTYYGGEFPITKDSTTIRYRLARAIGQITPRGELRIYLLKNFPKGESEPAYYDSYLRAVVMAENSEKWGKTHMGILAQELGVGLGLLKAEAPNNMMYRKKPRSADPEDNRLLENQVMRLRQMADIELNAANRLKTQNPNEAPNGSPKTPSIFDK